VDRREFRVLSRVINKLNKEAR